MSESLVSKHAEVIIKYSLGLKAGDRLLIQGGDYALPLIKECFRQALVLGAYPATKIVNEEIQEIMLRYGSREQISYLPSQELEAMRHCDALLTIMGSINPRMLSSVPGERMKWQAQGAAEYRKMFFQRMAEGRLRWCGTMHPYWGNAQEANMSLEEYRNFVYHCCYLNEPDPLFCWQEMEREQERICQILNQVSTLRLISQDTDLRIDVQGRRWINCCGHENLPDGEVCTSPREDSAQGHISFSFPGIYGGREIEDIRLKFERGRVVEAQAAKGGDLLLQLLEADEGARYLGEVAIGTNYHIDRFTRHMLFDEKIGGTVHLAIGQGFAEAGGQNNSAIHWDMLCDMKQGGVIEADGQAIYSDGRFLI